VTGSRKNGQAVRTVEISLSEIVGWVSIVLRLAETRDEDTMSVQPGSMLRREAEAVNRVLGPIWFQLPADAREVACRELREVWSPARVAAVDAEIAWVAEAARLEGIRAEVKAQQWL
jgi:hypothetical protein